MTRAHINPWVIPTLVEYPLWPFSDIDYWHLGNFVQSVNVKEIDFPSGLHFHASSQAQIRLRDAFLCAGILTSPATYRSSSRAWAFFLEHIESLRPSPGELRLVSECTYWEEQTRKHFSERFGVGLAGWLMWNSYDILHIADAGPFISKAIMDPSSPYNRKDLRSLRLFGKNGGLKPDFFCLTRDGDCVIAESKGGIGPPSKLSSAKKKGKQQVENVEPTGVALRSNAARLVFASNFRHEGENVRAGAESCITVVDPEEGIDPVRIEVSADKLALHSYCKFLSLCGRSAIAKLLLRGRSIEDFGDFEELVIEAADHRIVPMMYVGDYVLGLEMRVAKAVFENEGDLSSRLMEILPQGGLRSTENTFVLPNGIVFATREQ